MCADYQQSTEPNHYWRAISQVNGYIIDDNICFGVLTTINVTWVLIANEDKLNKSDGYQGHREATATQASVPQILFYFYWKAMRNVTLNITKLNTRRLSGERFPDSPEEDSSSSQDRWSD